MSMPLEICLEELDSPVDGERFVRCVALPGSQPGLALDRAGTVRWMPDEPEVCGLWVSDDARLVLRRSRGAARVTVERGGRSLSAPTGKPVVLLDQDVLRLDERSFRVHVHCETEAIYEPERLDSSAFWRLTRAAAAAATLALGGVAAAGGQAAAQPAVSPPAPIEVRVRPPEVAARRPIDCAITSQKARRGGPLEIHARCPKTEGLRPGLSGALLDPKTGQYLPKGTVRVKTVTGKDIVTEASQLTKPTGATTVRIWVD